MSQHTARSRRTEGSIRKIVDYLGYATRLTTKCEGRQGRLVHSGQAPGEATVEDMARHRTAHSTSYMLEWVLKPTGISAAVYRSPRSYHRSGSKDPSVPAFTKRTMHTTMLCSYFVEEDE